MYRKLKQYLIRNPWVFKAYRLVYSFKKRPIKADYLFRLENLELTNACPMKCIMCARTYKMTRPQGFMDMKLFKKIIDEVSGLNAPFIREDDFWLHHFGESLLHPDFDKMISYCNEKGVKAGLSVNPMVMEENIAKRLIDARPNLLFLALDGHDDESFYKIRGVPNAYEKSKENILNFLKLKKEAHNKIKTVISMIDFPENRDSINKVRGYWKRMEGVDDVLLKPFTDWNGEVEKINSLVDSTDKKRPCRVKCRSPWIRMSIAWDGDVLPCCYDYDKKYVLGNVNDNSLLEIWNGERMQQLRREFISGNVKNPLCRKCSMLYQ
jgi:radical SAM protein with 4Fe4S-binding SPASM domain